MKKTLFLLVVISFLSTSLVYADGNPGAKLYRGVVNIVTAPLEIPKQARAYWIKGAQKTPHILVWIGSGAVWGFVQGVKRVGSGLWDVATFPSNQAGPLVKPDYVFEQWPRNPESGR